MNNIINLDFTIKLNSLLTMKNDLLQVIVGLGQVGKTTTVLKYLNDVHSGKYLFYSADEQSWY
jgi:predicted AAA+ superfamily ATPase